jgi:hypothetical protein
MPNTIDHTINLNDMRSMVCRASGTVYTHPAASRTKRQKPTDTIDNMVALKPIACYQFSISS